MTTDGGKEERRERGEGKEERKQEGMHLVSLKYIWRGYKEAHRRCCPPQAPLGFEKTLGPSTKPLGHLESRWRSEDFSNTGSTLLRENLFMELFGFFASLLLLLRHLGDVVIAKV